MEDQMKKIVCTVCIALSVLPFVFAQGNKEQEQTDGNITLKVFDAHAYGLDEYAVMAKEFETDNPGVHIDVQHAANDSDTILKARVNSNDIPDVFDVQSGTSAQSYYDYAYDWSNDTDILAKFNQTALNTGKDSQGRIMSLPWVAENMGLIYNKDLFAKAGIDTLPQTMDELEADCKKLQAQDITAFGLACKEKWVLGQLATHFMMDKKLGADGTIKALNDGSLTFATMPNFKNLFRFLDLVKQYGLSKPLEINWETSENKLANNQVAIIHMGDWCQSTLDKFNPDANLAFLPCPVSDDPADTTLLSSYNWTYIVNKDSKHLDVAKKYAVYILSSKAGQDWMCQTIGGVPGCKTDEQISGKLANDAASYIKEGKTNGWIHTKLPLGFLDTMGEQLQGYLMGGEYDAATVVNNCQDAWNSSK
jgi:raffinose/stachyose/melibiose transport system substrate-binding protein